MLRHSRHGIDLAQIGDLQQRVFWLQGIAQTFLDTRDQTSERSFERDDRRRIAGLTALNFRHFVIFFHHVAGSDFQLHHTA